MAKLKTTDLDLYGLLDILPSATPQEIKSAYRKKALSCHPDKNPDNPNAAKLFIQLSEVFAILSDDKARSAYDQTLKAREAAKARTKQLDVKRRKLKEDLERREQEAKDKASQAHDATRKQDISSEEALQREIERLKKEGSRKLQEEQELLREQIRREMSTSEQQQRPSFIQPQPKVNSFKLESKPRFKVKWSSSSSSYDHDKLLKLFSKYGSVSEVLVLKKKALVEFMSQKDAEAAFEGESHREGADLKLEWISKVGATSPKSTPPTTTPSAPPAQMTRGGGAPPTAPTSFADFEAMVLANLSKAAAAQTTTPASTS